MSKQQDVLSYARDIVVICRYKDSIATGNHMLPGDEGNISEWERILKGYF